MIAEIQNRPPEDKLLSSRAKIRESREFLLNQMGDYGTLHKKVGLSKRSGTEFVLDAVNPFALLCLAVSTCAAFAMLFNQTVALHPPSLTSPWNLIFYADEVVPGNPLKGQNMRK